jgi:N-acyl-D-aspartate/D-glutamate deacylase
MTVDLDVLIKNAKIVDGIKDAFTGSIGIRGGARVVGVGEVSGDAGTTIDATGLVAMPGFVDSHSHADWSFPWYPRSESAVMQGCTTVVAGQCGGSPGPLGEHIRPPRVITDEIYERSPFLYHPPSPLLPIGTVNDLLEEKYGWGIDWRTMGEYFEFIEGKGISINYTPLVGHGTVRYNVMGEDYKRPSTEEERDAMKGLIRQAMEEGCIGMSAGLDYDPDVFAEKSEIDECVAVLKDYGGIYAPHWRRTGRRREIKTGTGYAEPQEGIVEVLDTSRKTGVRMNIAHLAPGYHTIPPMTPKIGRTIGEATLAPIDEALEEGLEVSFDIIPWECWEPLPYLCSVHFTQWLRLLGSRERLSEWLRVEEFRKRAWEEIESGKLFQRVVINPCLNAHWAENLKILKHGNGDHEDKTLAEVAEKLEKDPWDALCDLIVEDPDSRGAHTDYRGIEEQMKVFFKHSVGTVGLDVSVIDGKWQQRNPPYSIPLPDTYSGYPKFLNRYVRDGDLFTLEEAVQKCAALPAKFHGIEGRGVIRAGAYADIVLVDLPNLKIVGKPEESNDYPEGMRYVLVNGTVVVEDGEHTGARPGKVLTRKG